MHSRLPSLILLLSLALSDYALAQDVPPLQFRKWSGKLNVPDPVALSVDNQGRVFVTQTQRRKIQDLDIRQHSEWIPNDLGLRSVADKQNFYHSILAIGGDQELQSRHVQDWNEDGEHDWRDLTVVSERIYRLQDKDHDGTADEITIFAEDFRTEVTGVAAGVLAHEGKVYATIAPDVWRLSDKDLDGVADDRSVLATGFGLHIAYGGHDMHGLTVGPDGRLYWSIGDKGIHVVTPEGKTFAFPDEGGVLRCELDGSNFEVFAHGLRNVQEVAFDQYGNMFGVDNDSDSASERERFVYIVDQMDAGWRCFYQYRGEAYNPWIDEKLWELAGENHPAYIVPPIQHYVDGPAGFKFNPGTALSPEYQDYFFLTEAPKGKQHAFQVLPNGDSFKMVNAHQFGEGLAIVGLAFGPDGALYGADWDGGYPLDQKGSVIRIDVSDSPSEERREVQHLLATGLENHSTEQLVQLLGHADQRVRLAAQFQLVAFGRREALSEVASASARDELARLHAVWGLGQLARRDDIRAVEALCSLVHEENAHVRGQAIKTLGEMPQAPDDIFPELILDGDLHVRTLAMLALARHPSPTGVEPLLKLCESLPVEQHYVRHAISTALAACATSAQLAQQHEHASEMRRMCSVLALRKRRAPEIAVFLDDASDWVANAVARGIHDDQSIPEAVEALALMLDQRETMSEAFFRRVVNANFRLGTREAQARLIEFLQTDRVEPERAEHVMRTLEVWLKPDVLDRVQGIHRPLESSRRQSDQDSVAQVLFEELTSAETSAKVRTAAVSAILALEIRPPVEVVAQFLFDETIDAEARAAALPLVGDDEALLARARRSSEPPMQLSALRIAIDQDDMDALQQVMDLAEKSDSVEVRQRAIRLLSDLSKEGKEAGESALKALLRIGQALAEQKLPSELGLDVYESLSSIAKSSKSARSLLKKIDARNSERFVQLAAFAFSRDGGSAKLGESIFRTHVQAQCARCHRIGPEGSEVGPELTQISKKRDADYLMRSILEPSKDIEEKYRSRLFLLDSDELVKGVVQRETEDEIFVADEKGKVTPIPKEEIIQVKEQQVSLMPEMHEVLTPREVRDLLAYLRQLK